MVSWGAGSRSGLQGPQHINQAQHGCLEKRNKRNSHGQLGCSAWAGGGGASAVRCRFNVQRTVLSTKSIAVGSQLGSGSIRYNMLQFSS